MAADLRAAVDDFNAVTHRQTDTTPPTQADLRTADLQLRWAQHALATVASLTAVMAAWRVAALARQGGLTVAEGALFGGAVGLLLGLLLLVLGAQLCRGNELGDRLATGAEIVEETDHLEQSGAEAVAAAYADGRAALDLAAEHRARGDEARTAMARLHWDADQRAAMLLGVDRPPVPRDDYGVVRPLPLREDADAVSGTARRALVDIAAWLQQAQGSASRAELVVNAGPADEVELGAWDGTALMGQRAVIHGPRVDNPVPRREPRWLVALGAALTIAAAMMAANATAPPDSRFPATTVTIDAR
jgi:hypothetical protein